MRQILQAILLFTVLFSWACHERIIVYPPARVPNPSTSEATVSSGKPDVTVKPSSRDPALSAGLKPSSSRLDSGDAHFRQGRYERAIEDYEAYIENNPESEIRDRILFNMGLSRALSPGPGRNWSGAKDTLNRLVRDFPDSGYRNPAELILGLISEVEQLNQDVHAGNAKIDRLQEELNRLKEIDLRRRPSRPE